MGYRTQITAKKSGLEFYCYGWGDKLQPLSLKLLNILTTFDFSEFELN